MPFQRPFRTCLVCVFSAAWSAGADARADDVAAVRRLVGPRSCAAVACHGRAAVAGQPVKGAEFAIWIERDPHARAGQSLRSARGRRMLELLGITRESAIVDAAGYANCLRCHTTSPVEPSRGGSLQDGVSCEACHGPAEHWLVAHTRRDWSAARARRDGMVRLDEWLPRARRCAACHIGSTDREVNHDLMAAGHPPLQFEFVEYHALLPRHWHESAGTAAAPQASRWLSGQAAAADAGLALLALRAGREEAGSWPELAEYECAACHHHLGVPQWNPRRDPVPAWRGWNFAMLEAWSRAQPADRPLAAWREAMEGLRPPMQSWEQLHGERASIARQAAGAQRKLAQWISNAARRGTLPASDRGLRAMLAGQLRAPRAASRWETAVQSYLAARSLGGPEASRPQDAALEALRRAVLVPPGDWVIGAYRDAPRRAEGPGRLVGPAQQGPEARFRAALERWLSQPP